MKDKDVINLFDHISPEILAETDLDSDLAPGDLTGLASAGNLALDKAREKAVRPVKRRSVWPSLRNLGAVAAALAIIIASILTASAPRTAMSIAIPDYPQGVSYYDNQGRWEQRQVLDPEFLASLSQFSYASAAQVFAGGDRTVNSVYSPLSLYMALAMVSEGAGGETQSELLRALHMPDIDLVRSETGKLFKNLYTDNEIGKLNLANSLWLNQDVEFDKAFLELLARDYYAHSFSVDFKDPETAKQISQWVSQNTGGKLGYDPRALEPGAEQIMSMINTVYFYDQWSSEFDSKKTKEGSFELADGSKVKVPFMNSTTRGQYVQGPGYLVTRLDFKNDQSMLLILPDEGILPYDILSDPDLLAQSMTALSKPKDTKSAEVILSLPKFNFKSQHNLRDTLAALGVKLAFTDEADFSKIANTDPMFISDASQNLSISIDEKGCEAAAYTEIFFAGSSPAETIEMILDRPFIFAITDNTTGSPLFIGVVNNPTSN